MKKETDQIVQQLIAAESRQFSDMTAIEKREICRAIAAEANELTADQKLGLSDRPTTLHTRKLWLDMEQQGA